MTKKMLTATVLSLLAPTAAFALTTPAAPASVDTNAEKAAWEALMSPAGEYAALAAYTAVLQKHGQVEPYASILRSEQNHVAALSRQLQRYGVVVPANPYLGKIPAPDNLKAAAQAEVEAEVNNVALYDRLMALSSGDTQLTRVFTNLRTASQEMHLPMFQKAAANGGKLDQATMQDSHNQMVPQNGMGRGLNAGNPRSGMGAQRAGGPGRGINSNAQQNQQDCPMQHALGQGRGVAGVAKRLH